VRDQSPTFSQSRANKKERASFTVPLREHCARSTHRSPQRCDIWSTYI